jgi:hypothetical protein
MSQVEECPLFDIPCLDLPSLGQISKGACSRPRPRPFQGRPAPCPPPAIPPHGPWDGTYSAKIAFSRGSGLSTPARAMHRGLTVINESRALLLGASKKEDDSYNSGIHASDGVWSWSRLTQIKLLSSVSCWTTSHCSQPNCVSKSQWPSG